MDTSTKQHSPDLHRTVRAEPIEDDHGLNDALETALAQYHAVHQHPALSAPAPGTDLIARRLAEEASEVAA